MFVRGRLFLSGSPSSLFPLYLICSPLSLQLCDSHCTVCLYSASKLGLHLLASLLLSHTLRSSHCPCVCLPHSHVSPTATGPLAAFEVLSVVTSWLCDKGLQAKPALMNIQPHYLNGLSPSRTLS